MAKMTEKTKCLCCGIIKETKLNYYSTKSVLFAANSNKVPFCKDCVNKLYDKYIDEIGDKELAVYQICSKMGWYFDEETCRAANMSLNPLGTYSQRHNVGKCKGKTFEDTVIEEHRRVSITAEINEVDTGDTQGNKPVTQGKNTAIVKDYKKNKISVINSIGYDPFMHEIENDKALLYWMLENMLDETTIEDTFKLSCVIQIVKNFGQLEHLNKKISIVLSKDDADPNNVKSLISAKDSLYSKTLNMAKENGISIINSLTKSKGTGTLSGKIRELQEIGLEEIFVNAFDIETGDAMRQVAEISSSAIYNKLRLDENEYTNIISEQRKLIEKKDNLLSEIEEKYRLAKVKLAKIEVGEISVGGNVK